MTRVALADVTDYSTIVVGLNGAVAYDLTGRKIKGAPVVLERVLRSWLGSPVWAPDRGFDITSLENGDFTPNDVATIRKLLTDAAMSVDYVLTAAVAVSYSNRTLRATGAITLVDGRTYPLEVPIGEVGAAIRAQLAKATL